MRTLIGLTLLASVHFTCLSASAQPHCPFDASTLLGGQVYYFDGTTAAPLSAAPPLEGRQRKVIDLYYVVKSNSIERTGVLVIKSARLGTPLNDDTPKSDRVGLKRLELGDRCESRKPFVGSVSTQAYSEYHDYGQDNGEHLRMMEGQVQARNVMKNFHTSYEGIGGRCRGTDAKTRVDGTYEARSNRAQFSFDTEIVDYGFNSASYNIASRTVSTGWSYLFPSAFADPQKLRERTVEIKRYRTNSGIACVPFQIQVRGPVQALRVNDLEGRTQDYGVSNEYRFGPTTGSSP